MGRQEEVEAPMTIGVLISAHTPRVKKGLAEAVCEVFCALPVILSLVDTS